MGLRERVSDWLGAAKSGAPIVTRNFSVPRISVNGDVADLVQLGDLIGQDPSQLWRSQPHLRTVVDYLARNVAQLGVHVFERVGDTDRRRTTDSVAARLISKPNPVMTRYDLVAALVSDLALWDNAYWHVAKADTETGWAIWPIPASWVKGTSGGTLWQPEEFLVQPPSGQQQRLPASQLLHFHGWDPIQPGRGTSPVETLKLILAEQLTAYAVRDAQARNGNRISAVLTRPAGAPLWSPEDRAQFKADWKNRYGAGGVDEGGTPILPDGMQLERMAFSSTDQQFVEASKLALSTVAAVYHVSPIMVGVLDNANYSNVREFRRMLYGDTLGPILSALEARWNAFLLPMIGAGPAEYVEFNINEKLQGSFEEQAAVSSAAVGAPWLTRNEQRAMQNRPALPGGDELVTPLNVLIGGQASPQDGGSPKSADDVVEVVARRVAAILAAKSAPPGRAAARKSSDTGVRVKVEASKEQTDAVQAALVGFFGRQARSVLSAIGAKTDGPDWWDSERWDGELAADLFEVSRQVATEVGQATAESLGFPADAYDESRTVKFLEAVAQSRAAMINATTLAQLQDALAAEGDDQGDDDPAVDEGDEDSGDEPLRASPGGVFDLARDSRAAAAATTLATTWASFGATESAKQTSGSSATKTWVVNSANPRSEHADMDGETVGIDEKFSNGADWPGDPVLGADGVAGCECSVEVEVS